MAVKNTPVSQHESGSKEMIAADLIAAFELQLRKMLWTEKALLRFIPLMMEKAASEQLTEALRVHHRETKGHVSSLEAVFKTIRINAESVKDVEMESMLNQTLQSMKDTREAVRDELIVTSTRQIEQYEYLAYQALAQMAESQGLTDSARLLQEISIQEKAFGDKISV